MDETTRERWTELETLLRQRIGLNPEAVGFEHVRAAVAQHLATSKLADPAEYLARLRASDEFLQQLVELLVVPESWCFRDLKPFEFLEQCVAERWKELAKERPLRLLSVPCGGGEEPFSMALTLLNQGVGRFRIDAIDISQHAIRQAERGSFAESSFREKTEVVAGFRERYFHRDGVRWAVNDDVRARVRFRQANVVEPGFLRGEACYDVIFCRNLLIYLDPDGRRAVLANLHRLLDRDGVLYVGHVEAEALRRAPFAPCSPAFPFAFRARHGEVAEPSSAPVVVERSPTTPRPLPKRQFTTTPTATKEIAAAPAPDPRAEFDATRHLADQGRLDEAAANCREWIGKHPLNAEVFCLLGVVRQAQGDVADAEKCFQKALYLDPRQHESLVHLALLAKQRGDAAGAKNYRRRADKIQGEA